MNKKAYYQISFLLLYFQEHTYIHMHFLMRYLCAVFLMQIYRRATVAYGALSARLGEQSLFFEDG